MRPLALSLLVLTACGSARGRPVMVAKPSLAPIPATPMPAWVGSQQVAESEICGVGIAGRTLATQHEKAKALATERATTNLAGTLEASVVEAQIIELREDGHTNEWARSVSVDPETIARVQASAKTEVWYDVHGEGPAGEVGFTYAKSCLPAALAASELKIARGALKQAGSGVSAAGERPAWLSLVGSQRGARLCAVGYSDPGYAAEGVVENVVDDVRAQLITAARSVVMSAFEEVTRCDAQRSEQCAQSVSELTAAATEAVSRGVVVTHFWFDKGGIGPRTRKRSVYGWGCVYPVQSVQAAQVESTPALDQATVEKVKERAQAMFDELEGEEFARRAQGER